MGMPKITLEDIDFTQAINNIIASIALEESAISHMLNAEGEKVQKAVSITGITVEELLNINNSVAAVVNGLSRIEQDLAQKLKAALDYASSSGGSGGGSATFSLNKTDANRLVIDGGTFVLKNGLDETIAIATSLQGKVVFPNIPYGQYTLAEIAPPINHKISTSIFAVDVSANGAIINGYDASSFNFENDLITSSFMLRKVEFDDALSNVPIEGASFTLYDGPYPVGGTQVSNKNGYLTFSGITPGLYTLQEAQMSGYTAKPPMDVVVDSNGNVSINSQVVGSTEATAFIVQNFRDAGVRNLTFYKRIQNTNTPLAGAEFILKGVDVNYSETRISGNTNGVVTFENLPAGKYTLVENSVPSGYVINKNPIEVIVPSDNQSPILIGTEPVGNGYIYYNQPSSTTPDVFTPVPAVMITDTGDTDLWWKIAEYGDYSLLIRGGPITYNSQKTFRYDYGNTPLSTNYAFTDHSVYIRTVLNAWYNGYTQLPANAKLRKFAVTNNAVTQLGVFDDPAITNGQLTMKGISSPLGVDAPTGEDVIFPLSWEETILCVSTVWYPQGNNAQDSVDCKPPAPNNYATAIKGPLESGGTSVDSNLHRFWLRTPYNSYAAGALSTVQNGAVLALMAFQNGAMAGNPATLFPAIWVKNSYFN
jgi:hypothetical protein